MIFKLIINLAIYFGLAFYGLRFGQTQLEKFKSKATTQDQIMFITIAFAVYLIIMGAILTGTLITATVAGNLFPIQFFYVVKALI